MKTILELCAGLPATEGELRERELEFNQALWLALGTETALYPSLASYMDDIADAKAATDALLKRKWRFSLNWDGIEWEAELYWARNAALDGLIDVTATASTMPLTMSACALLAASAISPLPRSDS